MSWQLTNVKRTGRESLSLRRGERAADAAAVAVFVGEAVPVLGGGLEPGRHEAAGPVGVGGDLGFSTHDDVVEFLVLRDLDGE